MPREPVRALAPSIAARAAPSSRRALRVAVCKGVGTGAAVGAAVAPATADVGPRPKVGNADWAPATAVVYCIEGFTGWLCGGLVAGGGAIVTLVPSMRGAGALWPSRRGKLRSTPAETAVGEPAGVHADVLPAGTRVLPDHRELNDAGRGMYAALRASGIVGTGGNGCCASEEDCWRSKAACWRSRPATAKVDKLAG